VKLPRCYPDEILISRLIRHATITGVLGSAFLKNLFGSERASVHPFIPSGVQRLSDLTGEPVNDIVSKQTLAPLFSFFLPEHSDEILMSMLGNNSAAAYRASQMPSFSSGNSLKLKSCVLCARFDIKSYGVAYWHRTHQVPGLTTCHEHRIKLDVESLKQRRRIIPGFLPKVDSKAVTSSPSEQQVARFTFDLLNFLSTTRSNFIYMNAYKLQLVKEGLLTKGSSIKRKKLMESFWLFVKSYPSLEDTPTPRHETDYRYFSELLIPGTSHHPFRHLLFATWLFGFAYKLIDLTMSSPNLLVVNSGTNDPKSSNEDSKKTECLALLKKGVSLNKIYKTTGKSRCYLKRLAAMNGVDVASAPRKISKKCIAKVVFLAQRGAHRNAIAGICCIGVGSVEQIIASIPGLVLRRRQIKFESKRRRCRAALIRYKERHPEAIRRDFKLCCNQPFYWLYSNDNKWLEDNLPSPMLAQGRKR
jgi:hypothetical protein